MPSVKNQKEQKSNFSNLMQSPPHLLLDKSKHLLPHAVLKLFPAMPGYLAVIVQAHHHQLRQIAATHVKAQIHGLDHTVTTIEKLDFFTQLYL